MSRTGVSVLLLLAVLPLLLAPTVTSQQYTTYTISQSITTQVTTYGGFTVGEATVTTVQMQTPVNIYSGNFTMQPAAGSFGCAVDSTPFSGNRGQYVSGSFSADYPISIYVITDAAYRSWMTTGTCDNPPTSIATVKNQRQSTFSGILTETGNWDLVYVLGRSGGQSAVVNVEVNLSKGSTIYTIPNPIISFSYYTSVMQVVQTVTSTIVSMVSPQPIPLTPQSTSTTTNSSQPWALILGIGLGLAVALGAAFLYSRRRKQPKVVKAKPNSKKKKAATVRRKRYTRQR